MTIEQILLQRSNSTCELCSSDTKLSVYEVPPVSDPSDEQCIMVCDTCLEQINTPEKMNPNHWRCLNDSMWSQVPAVQVMAWRLLDSLKAEGWPQDLLDMLYLEEEMQAWAKATQSDNDDNDKLPTLDSNGTALNAGDSVTIIKDLNVKGADFTAKRGTMVKNISLTDNPKHIEGRVNGTRIVLLSCFLKKMG